MLKHRNNNDRHEKLSCVLFFILFEISLSLQNKKGEIMTNSTLARVEYPSKEVQTKYGTKINVVFQTESGEKVTKWDKPDNEELKALKKGQLVRLITHDNNKIAVLPVNNNSAEVKTKKSSKTELQNDFNARLNSIIEHYQNCDEAVREKMSGYKKEESLRSITTTVFLQSMKGKI